VAHEGYVYLIDEFQVTNVGGRLITHYAVKTFPCTCVRAPKTFVSRILIVSSFKHSFILSSNLSFTPSLFPTFASAKNDPYDRKD